MSKRKLSADAQESVARLVGGSRRTFYVDPIHGDDAHRGSVKFPIKTMAEMNRRLELVSQFSQVTVYVLNDIPVTDWMDITVPKYGTFAMKGRRK
jgi:hypothetical protein